MKFLFNASTNLTGGGAKNSAIFIKYALNSVRHKWSFIVSPQVAEVLKAWNLPQSNVTIFNKSPARSIKAQKELETFQRNGDFDLVYTMAGPAYARFTCPHVMGISNPYISHVDLKTFISTRPLVHWLPDALKIAYQSYYARKASRLIFQTATARDSFCRRLGYPSERTVIVANAFDPANFANVRPPTFDSPVKVLAPSMAYPHKMLEQLPAVAAASRNSPLKVEFLLTLDPDSPEWKAIERKASRLRVTEQVKTIGTYNYANAASIFADSDVILSLSILETFSATPLEAFGASRPLISADRPWAREISGQAALYIDPGDPATVVRAINALARDKGLRDRLTTAGREMLAKYGDHSARFTKLLNILEAEMKHHQS